MLGFLFETLITQYKTNQNKLRNSILNQPKLISKTRASSHGLNRVQ